MLLEAIAMFYDSTTTYAQTLSADAYGNPGALDMTVTYPTLQNNGEIVFWVQVYNGGTSSSSSTYEFILRGSATTDGTDLNGTTVDLVTSPLFTQSGTWCQKTDYTGGFFFAVVPSYARDFRYWEPYANVVTEDTIDLQIQWGLGLKSAMPIRVGNVSNVSPVTLP